MARIQYIPAIDGLRTLAILPVVVFHLGFSWMPGGFAGVDVFFVISGYLITSIILDECHTGTFSFLHFWKRRIKRILPALIVMILVTSAVGYCLRYGRDVQDLGLQGAAAIASLANICLWIMAGDYWGAAAENALFLHTWSLSVEEQFYLVFPLFLFLAIRFIPQHVFKVVSALAVCSIALYVYGADRYPAETFYLLPARIWELAAGSLLAIWFSMRPSWKAARIHACLAIIGVLIMLLSYALMSKSAVENGALLFPIIGAVLVILDQNNRNSFLNRMLASSPMVYIGKLSYSLYLWHWPIIVFSREFFSDSSRIIVNIIVIAMTICFSLLSYYFVEKTTRHHKYALPFIVLAVVISLIFSSYLYSFGKYYDVSMYNKVVWKGLIYDVAPVETDVDGWEKEGLFVERPEKFDNSAYANNGILRKYGSGDPDVVVIGSSIALMFSDVIEGIAKDMGFSVAFFGARGTSVFPESNPSMIKSERFFSIKEKAVFDENRISKIAQWKPDFVIVAGNWTAIDSDDKKNNALKFIEKVGDSGARIIFIEQPPLLDIKNRTLVQYLVHNKMLPSGESSQYVNELSSEKYTEGNAFIRNIASGCSYCYYMPTRDLYINDSGGILVVEGNNVLYRDYGHLSSYGASKIRTKLKDILNN